MAGGDLVEGYNKCWLRDCAYGIIWFPFIYVTEQKERCEQIVEAERKQRKNWGGVICALNFPNVRQQERQMGSHVGGKRENVKTARGRSWKCRGDKA